MGRPPKRPRDRNQLAKAIVDLSTGEALLEPTPEPEQSGDEETWFEALRRAVAELGRRGGLKGGKARAAKLSAEQRSEIAKRAAKTRWKKPAK